MIFIWTMYCTTNYDDYVYYYIQRFCLVPGYISRSVAGSYDNEGIAIFALMFTYYLWVSVFM